MKAVYIGGVRGYQPAIYKPGMGWTTSSAGHRIDRGPAVFSHRTYVNACPLAVARRRRLGLRAALALLAFVLIIIALVALALKGGAWL
jgi:hypothetical protein